MYINPIDSTKLVASVQRDYQAAAEAHRQTELGREGKSTSTQAIRAGFAFAGLVALLFIAVQYVIA